MKPYQALIWNEWRQMRGNVIALAGVTVLLWLLLLAASFNKTLAEYVEMVATALTIGLPLLYSIVLADSFAREFSQKTNSFLLELPVTPTKIFFCKYLANLGAFLVLVILEAQLMARLTCLTPGKHYTDGIKPEDWLIGLAAIATIWILAHAMVFLASLLGKKPGNGIVAIIVLPLPVILLLPGAMTATMFLFKDDQYWIISSLLFSLFFLYGFCVWLGWYLWSSRIACGCKIWKLVTASLITMFIIPWMLYSIAYFYFSSDFNSAIREANAAGIETDIKKMILPPVPDEQNAVNGILKFHHEYLALGKLVKDQKVSMPSAAQWTGTRFDFIKVQHENITPKNIPEATDFILNHPRMNQCNAILSEALKKPYCRFSKNYTFMECYSIDFMAYQAVKFLTYRAYAFRASGQDDDFFACFNSIDRISAALTEQPFARLKEWGFRLKAMEYQTAIAAGPDTAEAVKFYHQMIRNIDSVNYVIPNETFRIYSYLEDRDGILFGGIPGPKIFEKCKLFYLPRLFQSAAAWVRRKIEEEKLLKNTLIQPDIKSWQKATNQIPGIFKAIPYLNIWYPFNFRSRFESYKLCLALKIYHIKYGKFPDSLRQLVPEILPKVPINTQTGKDYIYQVDADGYILLDYPPGKNRPNQSYIIGTKYQTWDIKPEKAK